MLLIQNYVILGQVIYYILGLDNHIMVVFMQFHNISLSVTAEGSYYIWVRVLFGIEIDKPVYNSAD